MMLKNQITEEIPNQLMKECKQETQSKDQSMDDERRSVNPLLKLTLLSFLSTPVLASEERSPSSAMTLTGYALQKTGR